MGIRVLICAQDVQLFLLLQHILAVEGVSACFVDNLRDAELSLNDPDIRAAIIDWSAPNMDAPILSSFRIVRSDLAIAIIRKRPDPELERARVDLTLSRPFDPVHLVGFLRRLKLDALIEKSGTGAVTNLLRFADLDMNIATAKVSRSGHDIHVTALQFRLLRHLLQNPEIVHSRESLIAAAWLANVDVEPRTVDIHIGHIRRALKNLGPDLIRTVRTGGYALDVAALRGQQSS